MEQQPGGRFDSGRELTVFRFSRKLDGGKALRFNFCGRGVFPSFHSAIDHEGAKREEGGDKDYCGATDGPVGGEFGPGERNAKCDEQDAMEHSNDFDGNGDVPDVFEGHGDAEED